MSAKLHIHRLQPPRLPCPAQGKISNLHESASAHGTSRAAHSRRSKDIQSRTDMRMSRSYELQVLLLEMDEDPITRET